MKLYFSTRHIPGLARLRLTERLARVRQANQRLTGPQRLLLNVIKLVMLSLFFIFVLRSPDHWHNLVWALLSLLIYPLILKPVQYGFCAGYIDSGHTDNHKTE
ncbi:DUF6170 family protein [Bowmanella dokdonensis]|uniref:Uncharacterized protein n=1 Tax=Bowmanella dokdonensis TaxID=751969 RepID=A0A939DR94_9ALTE|nr:DUF6170 family protein [Bowmanella dokdonensis]MBN7827539.1 hypothetical protein [Bowmanella dokdonensis]